MRKIRRPQTEEVDKLKMKRVYLSLAVIAAVAFAVAVAFGQDSSPMGQGPGPRGGRGMDPDVQLDHLSQQLKLTGDQKKQIKPILQDQAKKLHALHEDASLSPEERWDKVRQIHEDTIKHIRPLLTADQQKQYDEMNKKGAQRGPGGHHPQGEPPPPPPEQSPSSSQ